MAKVPQLRQRPSKLDMADKSSKASNAMEQPQDELEASDPFMPAARTTAPVQDSPEEVTSTPRSTPPSKKKLSKLPSTTTPKSKKRKPRSTGYADDSDSDYRARTPSSRKSSRRSRRASFDSDPDGDYGGSLTPTRTMTRAVKPRFPRRSTIANSSEDEGCGEDGEDEDEDERESLCLEGCRYYETGEMLECDGIDCGRRKFHPGCVGFRSKPALGRGRWWFCFECRKVEGKGMKTNGIFVEGEDEDGDGK